MPLPTPSLRTARLRLRPFTSADADALFALHSNADVLRYWDSPPWSERARADRFLAACERMAAEGSGARLAIDRLSDSAFIGWCSLTRWNRDYRSAALGYCLDDAAWGHGYATEAGRALLDWGFDTMDLNRVQAETDTRNAASARVLEKLGFVREGTLREDCVVNGDVSDSWVYGLIRRQWRTSPVENGNLEAVPGVAPPEPTRGPPLTVDVDGEVFEVRPDGRGGTYYAWASGPNEGYGFSTSPTEGCSLDYHRGFIRNFLDQVDPTTGFIGD